MTLKITSTPGFVPAIMAAHVPEPACPHEGFVRLESGEVKPIYLGHPDARCDECEGKFSNERLHPPSTEFEGLIEICGGHLMRLTTRKAP